MTDKRHFSEKQTKFLRDFVNSSFFTLEKHKIEEIAGDMLFVNKTPMSIRQKLLELRGPAKKEWTKEDDDLLLELKESGLSYKQMIPYFQGYIPQSILKKRCEYLIEHPDRIGVPMAIDIKNDGNVIVSMKPILQPVGEGIAIYKDLHAKSTFETRDERYERNQPILQPAPQQDNERSIEDYYNCSSEFDNAVSQDNELDFLI